MDIRSDDPHSDPAETVRVAVVGAGYWGINHVRTFARLEGCRLVRVCDRSEQALRRAAQLAPGARLGTQLDEVLADDEVDAVVLCTPAADHAMQAIKSLSAGKHVFVEKPMALRIEDALAVARRAEETGRTLMVGHLMLYHPAVLRLREMIQAGDIGDIYYLYALRVNLGRLRQDENAMWSLMPHDLSIIHYLLGQTPITVAARGQSYLQPGVQDVVFVNLEFAGGQMAQIQVSWLDPRKERRLTVVGSQRMVELDDVHPTEKLRIYDKGFSRPPEFTQFGEYLSVRQGDIHIPHVPMAEPLNVECRHFIECIQRKTTPRSGAREGLEVVKVLEAAQRSLDRRGAPVGIT
ncbi:MAG: Gfo/Idh/MocA family oxidoreductase [Myxococcales bacterium]|nr:Gfo/Idh/MocA family oxidoreductase [Myxococcota bacterium]MDW8282523.1 Gfo/Idh/MocA family oxidoreductase [Myxococcales bacterium]